MTRILRYIIYVLVGTALGSASAALAEEVIVQEGKLPGAEIRQMRTYEPNKAEFDKQRDETLQQLRNKNWEAFQSPANEATVEVETEAKTGLSWKGFGASRGRVLRRSSGAAGEALRIYMDELGMKGDCPTKSTSPKECFSRTP